MKKSQVAMEFLMTYGWAFMIILIMIGAIAYFGVTDPDRFISDRCTASSGFFCEDYFLETNQSTFLLRNNRGRTITIETSNIVLSDQDSIISNSCTVDGNSDQRVVDNRDLFEVTCTGFSPTLLEDSLVRVDLIVPFFRTSSGPGYTRTATFNLVGNVE